MAKRLVWLGALALAAAWGVGASPRAGSTSSSAPTTTRPAPFHDMKIDLAKRRIILQAKVCLTEGALELLVCKAPSKEYESIMDTQATPSELHAALMAMGLTPGKPARSQTAPDGQTMLSLPPRGAELTIRLRWKDKNNVVHEAPAADWLEPLGAPRNYMPPKTWVFVGSDLTAGGGYWADEDGDVISVANFAASVIDVPFESSNRNEILTYRCRKGSIPPVGTAVEVVIEPLPDAQHAPHARVIIEIDRFGRATIDGREVLSKDLMTWAQRYIADHAKGEVTLRVDAEALAWDIQRVQQELRMGGVYDATPQILSPAAPVLPRDKPQALETLQYWDYRFEHPREFIREPDQEAQDLLDELQARRQELESRRELYGDLAQRLAASIKKYQATTRPAQSQPEHGRDARATHGGQE